MNYDARIARRTYFNWFWAESICIDRATDLHLLPERVGIRRRRR